MCKSSSKCTGLITRNRKVGEKEEKSIIDFIIVCKDLEDYLTEMTIDEFKNTSLYRCSKTSRGPKIKYSDHNLLSASFSIKFPTI